MSKSIRQQIREALKYNILNRMTIAGGYYIDWTTAEVNHKEKTFSQRVTFPSVDLIWGPLRYKNSVQGGNSLGGYNHVDDLFIEAWGKESDDYDIEQDHFIADFEKFFGSYWYIPDSAGDGTVFNSIMTNAQPRGMAVNQPNFVVDFRVLIYYRTELTNPNQNF